MQVTRNWIIITTALCCSIGMFLVIKPYLLSSTGGFGPTILQAQSPVPAIVALLLAIAVGTYMACILSRYVLTGSLTLPVAMINIPNQRFSDTKIQGSSMSLLILGLGLGWTALQLQPIQDVLREGSLGMLAAEGVAWGILMLLVAATVCLLGGPLVQEMPGDTDASPHWATSPDALKLAACGACALPVVWLFAQSPMKGQVLLAAVLGSIAAGFAGRLVAPSVQPVLLFPSVCVFGALGQWVAGTMLPEEVAPVIAAGQLPHLLLPLPIDYAAGALVGVPIGLSWGSGFLQKDDAQAEAATS